MLVDLLDAPVRDSMMAGYSLSESEVLDLPFSARELEAAALRHADPAAFRDGVELRHRMVGVYSADRASEYEQDCRDYDEFVEVLHEKYGAIAHVTADGMPLGLRGHRVPLFRTMTRYGRLASDGIGPEVVDVAAEVEAEDQRVIASELRAHRRRLRQDKSARDD